MDEIKTNKDKNIVPVIGIYKILENSDEYKNPVV